MRYQHEQRYFAPDTSSAARHATLTRLAEYLLDMHGGIFAALVAVGNTTRNERDEREMRAAVRREYGRRLRENR